MSMIVLGRVIAPFGIKGWLRIHPFADDPAAWCALSEWWLCADDAAAPETWRPYGLLKAEHHGKGLIVRLDGVDDRSAAEALDGFYVAVPREAMPQTGEGEYYWDDLIGLEVVNEAGETLGRVASLIEATANDVLVVKQEGVAQERLLPFVDAVVKKVDVAERRIAVVWGADW